MATLHEVSINDIAHTYLLRPKFYDEGRDNYYDYYDTHTGADIELTDQEKDAILKLIPNDKIKRGDIVHIEEFGSYRNDGKLIFDGQKLVNLCYDIDDYGSVPSSFTIGDEFRSDHWINVIEHNALVWIGTIKYRSQLLANFNKDTTSFSTMNDTYNIRISIEEEDEEERFRAVSHGIKILKKSISNGEAVPVSLMDFSVSNIVYTNLYYDPMYQL